jgi:tetratricopeptide (TPR) repeat protein
MAPSGSDQVLAKDTRHSAERVLELTRAQGQRHVEADALRILGDVHARADPAEAGEAEASYREALGVAEQIGTPPLAARCHLGLGVLFRATGQLESAQRHLATAATMFRDMNMLCWLEKAEAEMTARG